MLKSLNIKNFKSFKDATLELSDFTLMIGANASGKSNAIEALQYLAWSMNNVSGANFEEFCIEEVGRGSEKSQKFDNTLPLSFEVLYQERDKSYILFSEFVEPTSNDFLADNYNKDVIIEKFLVGNSQVFEHTSSYITQLRTDVLLYKDYGRDIHSKINEKIEKVFYETKENFVNTLDSIFVLDIVPSETRGYSRNTANNLGRHGRNLSGILYQLCEDNTNKSEILECIKSLPEQHISDIDFVVIEERKQVMVKLIEEFKNKKYTSYADSLSDGTLRVLAIIAFILSSPKDSLLLVEEIDNGIHPARVKTFLEKIRTLAKEREIQILMTSHNPALLDAMPLDTLEDVVCCYRDKEEGDSRLVRLGDLYQYPELIAQGTLGELVTDGIVDKFVHDKRTEEEIVQENVDWLEDFKKRQKEAYNEI